MIFVLAVVKVAKRDVTAVRSLYGKVQFPRNIYFPLYQYSTVMWWHESDGHVVSSVAVVIEA